MKSFIDCVKVLKLRNVFLLVSGLFLLTNCNKVPEYVIQPDDMAELMAEMHIGETVVESNFSNFRTDSAKMLLKQSILAKHGYTMEQLDTSFMWYGGHLKLYSEVYDKTIEIIENRLEEAGVRVSEMNALETQGDSTDIWDKGGRLIVRQNSPTNFLTFLYEKNDEWKTGDIFVLRAKFAEVSGTPSWAITTDYDDGTFEIITSKFSTDGWQEVTLYTDSTKTNERIYGYVAFDVKKGQMTVDSIQLIRKDLDPRLYSRKYRQKRYNLNRFKKEELTTNETEDNEKDEKMAKQNSDS